MSVATTAAQAETSTNGSTNGVTEDEAALYDRQIRLWGLEAQGKIRDAHVMVLNLDGLTTEAVKNWVLAGIHKLTLADVRPLTEYSDLSAGFFWREDDVGKERLASASMRIQALNPLVKIDVLSAQVAQDIANGKDEVLAELKPDVLVLGVPSGPKGLSREWQRESLISLNHRVRALGIPFYCAQMLGFNGWFFSDLGNEHEYVFEKSELTSSVGSSAPSTATQGAAAASSSSASTWSSSKRLEKRKQAFVPLDVALNATWKGLSRAQVRRKKPNLSYFGALAVWRCAAAHEKGSTSVAPSAEELSRATTGLIEESGLDLPMITASEEDVDDFFHSLATTLALPGEFSPSCAMLGGILAQDVLNAVGGRGEPIVNWFQLQGSKGQGQIFALSTPAHVVEAPSTGE